MPNIESARKQMRASEKRRKMNTITKKKYKSVIKEYKELALKGDKEAAIKLFPRVQKELDIAAKKNVVHHKTADRKKSRLIALVK